MYFSVGDNAQISRPEFQGGNKADCSDAYRRSRSSKCIVLGRPVFLFEINEPQQKSFRRSREWSGKKEIVVLTEWLFLAPGTMFCDGIKAVSVVGWGEGGLSNGFLLFYFNFFLFF